MIAWLCGLVRFKNEQYVVLDVAGVGYRVFTPAARIASLSVGQTCEFHVTTQVRADAIHVYGFATPPERDVFLELLGVSGVGATTALGAISTLGCDELIRAVNRSDLKTLQRIPKVGRRIAQRMAVELANRLPIPEGSPRSSVPMPASGPVPNTEDPLPLVLARLGFRRSEIEQAQYWLLQEGMEDASLDDRIQAALKFLGGR